MARSGGQLEEPELGNGDGTFPTTPLFLPFLPSIVGNGHLEQPRTTLNPTPQRSSPHIRPLSSRLWFLHSCFRRSRNYFRKRLVEDIRGIAEETASQRTSDIDVRVLQSTLDALNEAGAREEVFATIGHTLALGSVIESVRNQRLVICLNAARTALGSEGVSRILWDILIGRWPGLIQSVEMVQLLRQWNNKNDRRFTQYVQRIVAQVVVDVRERDDRWISLVKGEFAVRDSVLRGYIAHGDSALLYLLVHVTRHAFHTGSWTPWVLSSLSSFNIHDTLPGLQHAFCALWNDILFRARDQGSDNIYLNILREIRRPYIDLHRGTDAAPKFTAATYYFDPVLVQPSSYRYCNIASHRQDLTSLIVHTPVPSSAIVPSPTQLSESPDALSYPPHTKLRHTPCGSTFTRGLSASHTPHRAQGLTSPPPATTSVGIVQATSFAGPSAPKASPGPRPPRSWRTLA
jgi:hypothetical protein